MSAMNIFSQVVIPIPINTDNCEIGELSTFSSVCLVCTIVCLVIGVLMTGLAMALDMYGKELHQKWIAIPCLSVLGFGCITLLSLLF